MTKIHSDTLSYSIPLVSRKEIRQLIRQRRKEITQEKRFKLAKQAALRILKWTNFMQKEKNIAIFLSFDGELDTQPLINLLWKAGKNVYLPALHPFIHGNLLFFRYDSSSKLTINRLKISEPNLKTNNTFLSLNNLDVLVIPLVAFDKNGNRLGMGGGFYDRILSNWERYNFKLIGYAYDCQIVDSIPIEKWDVPLPLIVTPTKIWIWPNNIR